jgi:hypothetical protein
MGGARAWGDGAASSAEDYLKDFFKECLKDGPGLLSLKPFSFLTQNKNMIV